MKDRTADAVTEALDPGVPSPAPSISAPVPPNPLRAKRPGSCDGSRAKAEPAAAHEGSAASDTNELLQLQEEHSATRVHSKRTSGSGPPPPDKESSTGQVGHSANVAHAPAAMHAPSEAGITSPSARPASRPPSAAPHAHAGTAEPVGQTPHKRPGAAGSKRSSRSGSAATPAQTTPALGSPPAPEAPNPPGKASSRAGSRPTSSNERSSAPPAPSGPVGLPPHPPARATSAHGDDTAAEAKASPAAPPAPDGSGCGSGTPLDAGQRRTSGLGLSPLRRVSQQDAPATANGSQPGSPSASAAAALRSVRFQSEPPEALGPSNGLPPRPPGLPPPAPSPVRRPSDGAAAGDQPLQSAMRQSPGRLPPRSGSQDPQANGVGLRPPGLPLAPVLQRASSARVIGASTLPLPMHRRPSEGLANTAVGDSSFGVDEPLAPVMLRERQLVGAYGDAEFRQAVARAALQNAAAISAGDVILDLDFGYGTLLQGQQLQEAMPSGAEASGDVGFASEASSIFSGHGGMPQHPRTSALRGGLRPTGGSGAIDSSRQGSVSSAAGGGGAPLPGLGRPSAGGLTARSHLAPRDGSEEEPPLELEGVESLDVRIHCFTFNMGNSRPPQSLPDIFFGSSYLEDAADIYVFSTQESGPIAEWEAALGAALGRRFRRVASETLMSIHILLYVSGRLAPHCKEVRTSSIATGVGNVLGNKGGVAITFNLAGAQVLVVGAHFAAHDQYVERRNADFHRICAGLFSSTLGGSGADANGGGTGNTSGNEQDLTGVLGALAPDPHRISDSSNAATPAPAGAGGLSPRASGALSTAASVTPPTAPTTPAGGVTPNGGVTPPSGASPLRGGSSRHSMGTSGAGAGPRSGASPMRPPPPRRGSSMARSSLGTGADTADVASELGSTAGNNGGGRGGGGGAATDDDDPERVMTQRTNSNLSTTSYLSTYSTVSAAVGRNRGQSFYTGMSFTTAQRHTNALLSNFDIVLWMGDLNYRIAGIPQAVKHAIDHNMIEVLWANDQLANQKKKGKVFQGFKEMPIFFAPTFKFVPGSDTYALKRIPAWTDRVLYLVNSDPLFADLKPLYYHSIPEVRSSDHKPVIAGFELSISPSHARGHHARRANCIVS